jgi:hypothetical protein
LYKPCFGGFGLFRRSPLKARLKWVISLENPKMTANGNNLALPEGFFPYF